MVFVIFEATLHTDDGKVCSMDKEILEKKLQNYQTTEWTIIRRSFGPFADIKFEKHLRDNLVIVEFTSKNFGYVTEEEIIANESWMEGDISVMNGKYELFLQEIK